jgi:hypothetical protein
MLCIDILYIIDDVVFEKCPQRFVLKRKKMKQLAFSYEKFYDRSILRQQQNNARPSLWVHTFTKRRQKQTTLCHSHNFESGYLPDKN